MSAMYFEEKGAELLKALCMSKAEFARRMGIRKQNVNILFKTKNIETIRKAANVLGVRFEMLVGYTSEQEICEVPCSQPNEYPVSIGPFGNIYGSFRGRPAEAFWFLIDCQEGDLEGVFTRKEIGDIDLIWGDSNCGVRHILEKHINGRDFPTVSDMISKVSDIIQTGHISLNNKDKAIFRKNGFIVIVRRNYRINGKKLESKNWILTAYSKESSNTTKAPPGIN